MSAVVELLRASGSDDDQPVCMVEDFDVRSLVDVAQAIGVGGHVRQGAAVGGFPRRLSVD